jgi:hypothetical protein
MNPSVIMDTSPDYKQFAADNPGFPVGFVYKTEFS